VQRAGARALAASEITVMTENKKQKRALRNAAAQSGRSYQAQVQSEAPPSNEGANVVKTFVSGATNVEELQTQLERAAQIDAERVTKYVATSVEELRAQLDADPKGVLDAHDVAVERETKRLAALKQPPEAFVQPPPGTLEKLFRFERVAPDVPLIFDCRDDEGEIPLVLTAEGFVEPRRGFSRVHAPWIEVPDVRKEGAVPHAAALHVIASLQKLGKVEVVDSVNAVENTLMTREGRIVQVGFDLFLVNTDNAKVGYLGEQWSGPLQGAGTWSYGFVLFRPSHVRLIRVAKATSTDDKKSAPRMPPPGAVLTAEIARARVAAAANAPVEEHPWGRVIIQRLTEAITNASLEGRSSCEELLNATSAHNHPRVLQKIVELFRGRGFVVYVEEAKILVSWCAPS
jgi:hypothetical protein